MTAELRAPSARGRPTRVGPGSVFTTCFRHRALVLELAKRDVKTRYRGSLLGVVWAFLSPLLMLVVFTFVFSTIFESRWNLELRSRWDFALLLFSGLIPFWFFSECVSRAPELMFQNASYVKRVVFPLEVLPWVTALSGLFHTLLSGLVLLFAYSLLIGIPPWTLVLAPLIFLPLLLMVLGISWLLASMGVFFRDLRQIVPVIVMLFMFLSPIFYPAAALPEWFRFYIELNPLAAIIEQLRGLLFFDRLPDWRGLGISMGVSWLVAWLGLWWFEKTRGGFADVV